MSEPEQQLRDYLEELRRWNQRINLTTVPADQAWTRHVEESLHLIDVAAADGARVVDVGSGAGVPGMVVAIVRPALDMTLVESDTRKAAFLIHVAGLLRLPNVRVAQVRAEDAGRDMRMRERFDLALSRALAPLPVLLELTLPLVAVGGRLCALVAGAPALAGEAARIATTLGGAEPYAAAEDVLVVLKERATPERFPRPRGVPSRHPLG